MQRCANTTFQRDGETVSAAAVRNRMGLCVLSAPATRVMPCDSAGAIVDQEFDAVVSTTVRILDAVDAFYGHDLRVGATQQHIDVSTEEAVRR